MKKIALKKTMITALILLFFSSVQAYSAVTPGEVITSGNYEKIKGMVPEQILNYVKDGRLEMKIGKLNYKPTDFFPAEQIKNREQGLNKGRYGIDESENCLMDKKSGVKYPKDVVGLPFPDIDIKESSAGMQVAYNVAAQMQQESSRGNFYASYPTIVMNPTGIERKMVIGNRHYWEKEDSKFDFYYISWMIAPYDIAGYGTLRWVSLDPGTVNQRWTTIPPMRKVRRLKGLGNDSQTSYKLQTAQDDVWGMGTFGHVNRTKYEIVEKKTALLPYWKEDALFFKDDTSKGYVMESPNDAPFAKIGAETEGWKGAPWALLDIIWVEQPVYVLKFRVDTDGYVYGDTESWVNADTFTSGYKLVSDLSGAPWKNFMYVSQGVQSKNGEFKYMMGPCMVMGVNVDGWGQLRFDMGYEGSRVEYRKTDFAKAAFTPGGVLRYLK